MSPSRVSEQAIQNLWVEIKKAIRFLCYDSPMEPEAPCHNVLYIEDSESHVQLMQRVFQRRTDV